MESPTPQSFPYVHGFSPEEQARLRKQAEFAEFTIYRDVDFSGAKRVLEVGSGVGAQTEILLRRFPHLSVDCVELNERQFAAANLYLASLPHVQGRYTTHKMDAQTLEFDGRTFDGAFLCWVLEHIPNPARVLSEVRRVLRPGSSVVISEVMNSSFFLEPYSPNIWRYWMAFNDFQHNNGGDPFVGAKLGNLLQSQGFRRIQTHTKVWHLDNREPERRRVAVRHWKELIMSSKTQLVAAGAIDLPVVAAMEEEFARVEADPNAVFFDAFMQATAEV